MRFDKFYFDSLQIDGSTYEHDVVIDHGEIRKRKKKTSKKFRDEFGHTPSVGRGGYTVEMPPTRGRHRCIRKIAGDERSKT